MSEQAVLHLIMNCIPSLDRDLLDSFLASLRNMFSTCCSVPCKHHPHSVFHCHGQTLPPSASRCVLASQYTRNIWLDLHSSPGTTWFLHNALFFSHGRKHTANSSSIPERWSCANILPGPGSVLQKKPFWFSFPFRKYLCISLLVIN